MIAAMKGTTQMDRDRELFWQRKLVALLHDAPDKCFDIANHESVAVAYQSAAGFVDNSERYDLEQSIKAADHFASAAERFGFPQRKCAHDFNSEPLFIHPLSGKRYKFESGFAAKRGAHSARLQVSVSRSAS